MAAGAMRFAAGMACSQATAPGLEGRSDSAGAATQATAVISSRQTPVNALLRMVNPEHMVNLFDSSLRPGFAIRSRLQAAAHHKSRRPSAFAPEESGLAAASPG